MRFSFERGDSTQPKGHALLYFSSDKDKFLATYMVVLPIKMEIGKYLPPMFASQMGHISAEDFSVIAIPPIPEKVDTYVGLRDLAELRNDDLIRGGILSLQDLNQAIQEVNEIAQEYARLYANYRAQVSPQVEEPGVKVDEVLYELMGEQERLEALSKLVVKIRFAAEHDEQSLLRETEFNISMLARYLPEWYRVDCLLKAAKDPSDRGTQLTKLYLERCYKLAAEDYVAIKTVEEAIKKVESS